MKKELSSSHQFLKKFLIFLLLCCNLAQARKTKEEPMRILFVVGHFPILSETFILNQITCLLDHGHDVYIYSFYEPYLDVIHADVKKYQLLDRTFYKTKMPDFSKFDIIYCQFGKRGILTLKILRKNKKWGKKLFSRIVTCFRGGDISSFVQQNGADVYNELFKQTQLFLPVCKYFKKRLIKLGCNPKNIQVHHSAIDYSKFKFKKRYIKPGEPINIVTINRFVEKKGIKYAIQAVARLVKKYPNIQYSIYGYGPLQEKLEQLIVQLNAQKNIEIHGKVTQKEIIHILSDTHIFVLASITDSEGGQEGIPNVLKEAMACGIPVVSTIHSGIPELVANGISGLLVPERNTTLLAKKIEYLIQHPEKWYSMGRAGRKTIEKKFDLIKTIKKLEKIFRKHLKRIKK